MSRPRLLIRTADEIRADISQSGVPDNIPREFEYPDQLISTYGAASILGVSRSTVLRWAREGRLRYVQVGTHMRFRESDVRALIRERGAS